MNVSNRFASTGPPPRIARVCAATLALALCGTFANAADGPDPIAYFEAEVRPVLVEACVRCHGPEKQKGGLRVDSREAILAGGEGGPAVVPGRPDESPLIAAVRRLGDRKMPPKQPLSTRQVDALARWVELKAPWPEDRGPAVSATSLSRPPATDHWAFRPLGDPRPPSVADAAWVRTPVDSFILARLEAEGLSPSPLRTGGPSSAARPTT